MYVAVSKDYLFECMECLRMVCRCLPGRYVGTISFCAACIYMCHVIDHTCIRVIFVIAQDGDVKLRLVEATQRESELEKKIAKLKSTQKQVCTNHSDGIVSNLIHAYIFFLTFLDVLMIRRWRNFSHSLAFNIV